MSSNYYGYYFKTPSFEVDLSNTKYSKIISTLEQKHLKSELSILILKELNKKIKLIEISTQYLEFSNFDIIDAQIDFTISKNIPYFYFMCVVSTNTKLNLKQKNMDINIDIKLKNKSRGGLEVDIEYSQSTPNKLLAQKIVDCSKQGEEIFFEKLKKLSLTT